MKIEATFVDSKDSALGVYDCDDVADWEAALIEIAEYAGIPDRTVLIELRIAD